MLRTSTSLLLLLICACFLTPGTRAQGKGKQTSDRKPVLDVLCQAYEKNKRVKDVTFTLFVNGNKKLEVESKKGKFDFVVEKGTGSYKLVVAKKNYLTKEITFNSNAYPFESSYDIQEILIECVPQSKDMREVYHAGIMTYDTKSRSYKIARVDTSSKVLQTQLSIASNSIDRIYSKAMKNGDGLAKLEEYHYAKGYFEIALEARPNDPSAAAKLQEMETQLEQAKQREAALTMANHAGDSTQPSGLTVIPDETSAKKARSKAPANQYYSVQVGAFIDWLDESAFTSVPELLIVQSSDYKRCYRVCFKTVKKRNSGKRNYVSKDSRMLS